MSEFIRFCLTLHNHQPVGNFDNVFEQAYQDSYLPFLDVFEKYDALKLSLHTSGPLMEWLDERHGEYLDRLAAFVAAGRIEIVGGAFYEPILTMIPSRDRVGQISRYTQWLESRLGADVRGMWVPERVWEQNLTSDIANAGIEYTILDDFHFKNAGLSPNQLNGYYVTENEGKLLRIFPGSEPLRYLIPFADPHETIDFLRQAAIHQPGATLVFGDDGEKFGTWPDTKHHVYDQGWLARFFDLLTENKEWLHTTTLSDAIDNQISLGRIYLPEGSYREMTEWALPVQAQHDLESLRHEFENDGRWEKIQQFVRGGYWRNFKVKYPETNEMYARMMIVSQRLQGAINDQVEQSVIDQAQRELYRGQCNCSFWHGAFGGAYLPHLRNAVFNHLIAAENILDQAVRPDPVWIDAATDDFNYDDRPEVKLSNQKLFAFVEPGCGGHLYELDVRSICHNLGATLSRRPEAYHAKVLAGTNQDQGDCASIHDRVVFKQEGLDQRVQYDQYLRKSMIDHFYEDDVNLESIQRAEANELGDFIGTPYEAKLRRNPDRIQVQMSREGQAAGYPVKITKGVTLNSDSSTLEIAYMLENLPQDRSLHFGVEFNFAGLPSGADDRFFSQDNNRLGHLGSNLDLHEANEIGLTDEWLGLNLQLTTNQPTSIWTFPIESVSQSEGGFELVHQSVVVHPHWHVKGDEKGRWSVKMELNIDTSLAESRMPEAAAVVG